MFQTLVTFSNAGNRSFADGKNYTEWTHKISRNITELPMFTCSQAQIKYYST